MAFVRCVKKYYFFCLALLLLLWAAIVALTLPSTQKALADEVRKQIDLPQHDGVYDAVKFHVSGQEVTLEGYVATEEEKVACGKWIAENIRIKDQQPQRNPITAVHNKIEVNRDLAPKRDYPWLIATVYGPDKRIEGVLKQSSQRIAILSAMEQQFPAPNQLAKDRSNQIIVNEKSWPAADWDQTLAHLPDFKKLLEGKTDKAARVIAATLVDGTWKTFPPEATDEELAAFLAPSHVSTNQIALAVQNLRTMLSAAEVAAQKAEQMAKLKAEQEARAKKDAERQAAEKAAAEAAKAAVARQAAESAKTPAYLGVIGDGKAVSLFGAVPSEEEKAKARAAAEKIYTGLALSDGAVKIETARLTAADGTWQFTAAPKEGAFVGLFPFAQAGRYFAPDVYDSELVAAFPQLKLSATDLASTLQAFRIEQTKAGKVMREEPYLSLLSDGKTITLSGEIADEASKKSIFDAVKKANPQLPVSDQLVVTPLVNEVKDLSATLSQVPAMQANMTGIAIARPGQAWRSAVIHSIYFRTGSDRSKDQERAVAQIQRVRALLPKATFEIVGHTDNVGKPDANNKLSLDRAQAFVRYATAAGIEPAALSARGAGSEEPIAPNTNEAGKALNRRVDVMLK